MAPGGNHVLHKEVMTTPLDHLHQFEDMICLAEKLPAGDIQAPNAALQVEWFYMSFHHNDCTEYICSWHRLVDKSLQTLAKYFEKIHQAKIADGLLQRKHDNQIREKARRKLKHKLQQG